MAEYDIYYCRVNNTMKHGNYAPSVKAQYEVYPYPPRDPEQEKTRLYVPVLDALDVLNHYGFAGRRDFSSGFNALVAGCGTGDSAIALAEQLRGTAATVTCLDLSETSLNIARRRAAIRGLDNITWVQESLLELPRLGMGRFDYINCSGVLHHLESPPEGLQALKEVLADDGVLGLMLYAAYGRAGVYQMQALMRFINQGAENTDEKIANTLKVIDTLPERHAFRQSMDIYAQEIQAGPSGIYDLLLHSHDRAYTIPELYAFLDEGGMQLVRLFGELSYRPETHIRDPGLLEKVQRLPLRSRQAVGELLHGKLCQHTVYAAKTPKQPPELSDIHGVVPALAFIYDQAAYEGFYRLCEDARQRIVFRMPGGGNLSIAIPKTAHVALIMKYVDGRRTLGEIFAQVRRECGEAPPSDSRLLAEFRPLFDAMHASHALLLRHRSVPPMPTRDEMQRRVSARYGGAG